ncbi:DNA mismatch repair protein MutT [Candidatus Aerophobetes bacterium]|uniref:DNA mismatch repair protein MutT n=1 Tax=Aerophobetes bacterium TaxID=2030807 RepID=A0A2A4X6E3_UNCAE|nr:MAG: DNA mismatch repair protein MutT [Candidatus Aerophobetes bacterium]
MVLKDGKILLGKRKGSHGASLWATPGGHLEYGETALECAKRELKEETGLIAGHTILGPYTNDIIKPENKHYITLFVFITEFTGDVQCLEPSKCEGWLWFPIEKFPRPLFCPINTLIRQVGVSSLKTFSL